MRYLIALCLVFILAVPVGAKDFKMSWDPSVGATGYMVQMSGDNAVTWGEMVDVGNNVIYTYPDVPEVGLYLFRVGAYRGSDVAWRYDAFLGYCGDCGPPPVITGLGTE